MTLSPGTRVGNYLIHAMIGAGGMGEVYRATDTKLGREVAIKIMRAEFADGGRLARFEREARTLAALNHAHIASLFGWEPVDSRITGGGTMLVMELVDGPTLETKLTRGALPLAEVLRIGADIADALAAAHDLGIVHRDLKPANIKLTASGTVKVLDFGIAKTMDAAEAAAVTATLTEAGQIVGTPAYMSPEQTRGMAIDARADAWAFGCVLFEMVTGRRAFDGATRSDVAAAVLQRDPDWTLVPANTPPVLQMLLRRCLQKDPSRRFRSMTDVGIILVDLGGTGPSEVRSVGRRSLGPLVAATATGAAVLAALATWYIVGRTPGPPAQARKHFVIPLRSEPVRDTTMPLAMSLDGSKLVVTLGNSQGAQLYLRALDRPDLQPIPGTANARNPFFSPDGNWIGFFTTEGLGKVPVTGGPVEPICRTSAGGATWGPDGMIYFTPYSNSNGGILKVPSTGGEPTAVTTPAAGEVFHRNPQMLPGGHAILFTAFYGDPTRQSEASYLRQSRIVVRSLDTGAQRTLIEGGSSARYVASGHIVYAARARVFAVPFDVKQLALTGAAAAVPEDIAVKGDDAQLAVSGDGTLAYLPRTATNARSIVWVDRQGTVVPAPLGQRSFESPRLSPDGKRIAAIIRENSQADVWVQEPTGALSRLTFDGVQTGLIWTPNGSEITFSTLVDGKGVIVSQEVDGARPARVVISGPGMWPGSWSRDGQTLAFMANVNSGDIEAIRAGESTPSTIVSTSHTEWGARLSPDDRWLAYTSNESGVWEIYVRPYPGQGARRQISSGGGSEVVWSRTGRELFYRNGTKLMAVDVQTTPTFSVGTPRVLFDGPFAQGQPGLPAYDVSPDGKRFLMVRGEDEQAAQQPIHVVLGWLNEVQRLSAKAP